MPYNTISLIDRNGHEMIFDMMTITLKEHLEDAIKWGVSYVKSMVLIDSKLTTARQVILGENQ